MRLVGLLLLVACRPGPVADLEASDAPGLELVVSPSGAVILDRRRVDVPAKGELRFPGVPAGLDLGSSQLLAPGARAYSQRLLPAGSEGARSPTLAWQVQAIRPGPRVVAARYRVSGLMWRAVYAVVLDADGEHAEIGGQVEIDNHAGAGFAQARVLLAASDADDAPLRELPGRITLAAAAIASVPLLPPRRVPAQRTLVFDAIGPAGLWLGSAAKRERHFPVTTTHDVRAFVEVRNDDASGLGLALPGGTVRFFRRDARGRLTWLEDQSIDAFAPGHHLRVPLGVDPELRGSRRAVALDLDEERHRLVEELEIVLENRAASARAVTVVERLPRSDRWRLTWWTVPAEKDDSRSARFRVLVPAGATTKFRYRVMYSW
jgi:hypothetical protein